MNKMTQILFLMFCSLLIFSCKKEETTQPPSNNAPATPSAPNPADGATNVSRSPVLSWTCSDPDVGDSVKYDIYFSSVNPPNTLTVASWIFPNYTMSGLDTNRTYYWRVTAKDSKGGSSVGPIWRFTTVLGLPTQGLVAYYPFDGNANDESGNGLHGTLHGATVTTFCSFNGISNYVTLPTTIALTYGLSISFWLKTTQSDPGPGLGARFLISRDLPGYQRDWCIGLGNGGKIQFTTGTQTNDYTLLSATDINDNSWKHIVVVRNTANTSKTIYVDGQISSTTTFDDQAFLNNSSTIYVGTNYSMVGFYNGLLDNIRIYNRALDNAEVQLLYNEGH